MNPVKLTFAMLLILCSGLLIGGILGFLIGNNSFHGPPQLSVIHKRVYKQLVSQLDLDEQQQQQTAKILNTGFTRVRNFKIKIAPEFISIISGNMDSLQKILNPEQKNKFAEIRKRKLAKMRKHLYGKTK